MTSIPATGDPTRPLHIAMRGARLLGIVSVLCGLVVSVQIGLFNAYPQFRQHFIVGGILVWLGPGVVLLVASFFLIEKSRFATMAALAAAGLQALCAVGLVVASVTLDPISPIPILLAFLWLAALAQLIYHLWRCFGAIRLDAEHRHGFDLVETPRPVLTVPDEQSGAQ